MCSQYNKFSSNSLQPCVSARIFSAMSLLHKSSADFTPLLPLLHSLVNAEIVSLKSKEENNDVYFINKKVCFSGYDYSSTMPAVDSISGSHVDLVSSIDALTVVLREATKLPRAGCYLDLAIECLEGMRITRDVSDVCSKVCCRCCWVGMNRTRVCWHCSLTTYPLSLCHTCTDHRRILSQLQV